MYYLFKLFSARCLTGSGRVQQTGGILDDVGASRRCQLEELENFPVGVWPSVVRLDADCTLFSPISPQFVVLGHGLLCGW